MKENIISDLNADLKKEKDILVDMELRFGGLNNKINKLKKESVWEDEEQWFPLIMCTLGGIIGIFIVYLEGGFGDWGVISFPLSCICGPFALFGFIGEFINKKDIKKCEMDYSNLKTEIQNQKVIVENIDNKLSKNKDNKLELLINDFIKELDSDSNNTIDVIQHDNEFMKILKLKQKIIVKMDKSENEDFTKQFIKLSNFLIEKEKNLQRIFKRIPDIDKLEKFDEFKFHLYEQIQFYNLLRINSLQMISSLIDDDRLTFFTIHENFDKLGVWNTNFENQFLSKMDILNSNIERLISEINIMGSSINQSIDKLITITHENTSSLSDKLSEVGSKLDVSNMLSTINTYQNYKINKNTKSLRQ
tara:strand:+ start:439 stop:1524 length:1086 start_codon:yes stop_codon:yes gene_type:complete